MNRWRKVKQTYDEREWKNVSARSVRRECMKVAIQRTREDWEKEKTRKRREWASDAVAEQNSLSKLLVHWDIKHHWAYNEVRKVFKWKDWAIISSFRTGHVDLKAQWKFFTATRNNKTCDNCTSGNWETMQHFLFKCDKYVNSRAVWLAACYRTLRTTAEKNTWDHPNPDTRLRMILFPFQEQLNETSDDERDDYLRRRIDMLKLLVTYVRETKRWTYPDDLTYVAL